MKKIATALFAIICAILFTTPSFALDVEPDSYIIDETGTFAEFFTSKIDIFGKGFDEQKAIRVIIDAVPSVNPSEGVGFANGRLKSIRRAPFESILLVIYSVEDRALYGAYNSEYYLENVQSKLDDISRKYLLGRDRSMRDDNAIMQSYGYILNDASTGHTLYEKPKNKLSASRPEAGAIILVITLIAAISWNLPRTTSWRRFWLALANEILLVVGMYYMVVANVSMSILIPVAAFFTILNFVKIMYTGDGLVVKIAKKMKIIE